MIRHSAWKAVSAGIIAITVAACQQAPSSMEKADAAPTEQPTGKWALSTESRDFYDVQLPANYGVMEPSEAPAACRNWLGHWADGKWNGRRPGALVVQALQPDGDDCTFIGIHAWGNNPHKPSSFDAGFRQVEGDVSAKRLQFYSGTNSIWYDMVDTDVVEGSYKGRDFIKLTRVPAPADR